MKEIKLNHGKVALVDDEDYDFLMQWKWYALDARNTSYARTAIYPKGHKGKQVILFMHRLIMKPIDKRPIDHINHNGLDNRKENLRICTQHENTINRVVGNRNGLTGIQKHGSKYSAKITSKGITYYLGIYSTAIDANKAYTKRLNKILNKSL